MYTFLEVYEFVKPEHDVANGQYLCHNSLNTLGGYYGSCPGNLRALNLH